MSMRALRALGALALPLLLTSPALADDARAIGDDGKVLTVGNWTLISADGGFDMRVADNRYLGWDLRDQDGSLLDQGIVPGSEGLGVDATPVLSRNPATGGIWLAWSRQAAPGTAREILVEVFDGRAWDAASLLSVAADSDDQIDPALIHDEGGTAWLAWLDGLNSRSVLFAGISSDGRILGKTCLSEGVSSRNGAPNLGIDAVGRLFAAFAGTADSGDVTLFVLTPNPIRGGVSHLPDPIIELGVRGTVPAPMLAVSGSADPIPSRVNLTVLGGTPVAWWTESEGGDLARFRYAAESEQGWTATELRTLDLRSGMVASVPEALSLVEARLRRVIDQTPGGGGAPPSGVPGLGRLEVRR